jgi:hypothetical protein
MKRYSSPRWYCSQAGVGRYSISRATRSFSSNRARLVPTTIRCRRALHPAVAEVHVGDEVLDLEPHVPAFRDRIKDTEIKIEECSVLAIIIETFLIIKTAEGQLEGQPIFSRKGKLTPSPVAIRNWFSWKVAASSC